MLDQILSAVAPLFWEFGKYTKLLRKLVVVLGVAPPRTKIESIEYQRLEGENLGPL